MKTVKEQARSFWHSLSEPQNVFLLLGSFFGLVLVFTTPPALVGDEPNHFFRAYQISDGVIIGTKNEIGSGGWLPVNVLETNRKLVGDIEMRYDVKFDTNLIWELRQVPLDEENKTFVSFNNTAVYSPVAYVPQIIGIFTGKFFGASALGLIYYARIFNLIFFLALSFWAIKKTPVFKWVFCFLWLTPTTMFQAASASVDAFTFGICFVAVAHFLFYAFTENVEIKRAAIVKIFALCFIAALCKQAYVFLPLLFLTIPRRKFKSTTIYLLTFFALIAVCFAAVGVWSYFVKPIFVPYRTDVEISPDAQLNFIFNNPFHFLKIVAASYVNFSPYYFLTFFGQLTWLDLFVPRWLPVFLFAVVIIIALFDKNPGINISKFNKTIFALIILCTALIIGALLYISWSPIAADRVAGIQGRYFIPVAPLFFLWFYNRKFSWKGFDKYVHLIVFLTVIFSLATTLKSIIMRYYI